MAGLAGIAVMATSRRGLGAICGGLLAAVWPAVTAAADAPPLPDVRVCVTLDVTGELVAAASREGAAIREPVEMTARFDFVETGVPPSALGANETPAGDGQVVAHRWYRDATASLRVGTSTTTSVLAADARRLLMARRGTTPLPYLANGFLTGDEFDLLDTPFDSLLLEGLLPTAPMEIGQSWEIPGDLAAGLLSIDTVESGVIEARIQEVADGRAVVGISGIIDGAVDGVPTHLTVEGSLIMPARTATEDADATNPLPATHQLHGRVARVSVMLKERRQASHVAPGFEVEARVLVERIPLDPSAKAPEEPEEAEAVAGTDVAADAVRSLDQQGSPQRRRGVGNPDRVWYREAEGRFDLIHDTRWRRVEDGPNGLVMRLIDRGALLGQCSITTLPQAPAATRPTRIDLERDVERSLAGQVVRVDSGEETDREDGLRVVRLASEGTAGQLPFRWIHYVLAAEDGSRASVTFMFEASVQQRFADADRSLIEGLRLPNGRSVAPPLQREASPPGATAAVPSGAEQQTR
jgi:hypothetical protein